MKTSTAKRRAFLMNLYQTVYLEGSSCLDEQHLLTGYYVCTSVPKNHAMHALKSIAEFIMKVYAPIWFTIKSKPSCKDGAKQLWMTILKSRCLSDPMRAIVDDPVIQHNCHFGHPENTLLSMGTDGRQHIRELGRQTHLTSPSMQ